MASTKDGMRPSGAGALLVWATLGTMALGMAAVPSAHAGDVAEVSVSWDGIDFEPQVDYERLVLSVSGPGGIDLQREFAAGSAAFIEPVDGAGNPLPDGSYTYELRVVPVIGEAAREALSAAREDGTGEATAAALRAQGLLPAGPLVQSGGFSVVDGAIADSDLEEAPAAAGAQRTGAITNQTINMDLIVIGSTCIGFDCVTGEVFGFDTLRLDENNLRIHFDDTSVAAGFPSNDWRIIANDSTNGGQSFLAIEDSTGGTRPFTVQAGAPGNALVVESTGDVGFGTNAPVVEMHSIDGDTPTLRLQQDGTGGFSPQTWDVAGNEANFFVRDVTNASRIPFKIRPSAPTDSLVIDPDGDVGLGTTSPTARLEVTGTDGASQILVDEESGTVANRTLLRLENNGRPQVTLRNDDSAVAWVAGMGTSDSYIMRQGTTEYRFTPSGRARWFVGGVTNFDMNSNGNLTIAGTLTENSDVNLKRDIEPVDGEAVLARVAALPVSTWSYKRDETGARHVGPMAQDFHAAFGLGEDETRISPRDVAGVALAAVKELQELVRESRASLSRKDAEIAALRVQHSALLERIMALEAERAGND